MLKQNQPFIFEASTPGRIGYSLPEVDVPEIDLAQILPKGYIREEEPNFLRYPNWILCVTIQLYQKEIMALIQAFIH